MRAVAIIRTTSSQANRVAMLQRRALHHHERVDRHALGLRALPGELEQEIDAVVVALAHPEDAAAADLDSCVPDMAQRREAVVVAARGDDRLVEVPAGVEIVVVVVEARRAQPLGLTEIEHPEGGAALEPERLDRADHLDDLVERRAVGRLPPRRADAEAVGAARPRPRRGGRDRGHAHQPGGLDTRVVVGRLWAVPAVLRAAAGLNAQERRALHDRRIVMAPVHAGRLVDEVEQPAAIEDGRRGPGSTSRSPYLAATKDPRANRVHPADRLRIIVAFTPEIRQM